MPNIDEVYAGKTLKASEFGDEEPILTIKATEVKQFKQKDGTLESKLVLSFAEEERQLVCNKTNSRMIAKYYGKESDNWVGKKIQLYRTDVEMAGEIVDAIRVRILKPKQPVVAAAQSENPAEGFGDEVPF